MILFTDCETTGVDSERCAVVEIALTPYDGVNIHETKVFRMRPHEGAKIDQNAMKIHGYTTEEVMTWEDPRIQLNNLIEWVDSFEKKFKIGGHNTPFDKRFMFRFFTRFGKYTEWVSRFRSDYVCTQQMSRELELKKKKISKSDKLIDLCEAFDIKLEKAHSAYHDIEATVKLYEKLKEMQPVKEVVNFTGDYQQARRKFLDSSYVMFNPEGDIFINKKTIENQEALKFILSEIWDMYCI